MSDSPQAGANEPASVASEVADYFNDATPDQGANEQVTSPTPEIKEGGADKTKENNSEATPDDKSKSDDKSKETEVKKTPEAKPDKVEKKSKAPADQDPNEGDPKDPKDDTQPSEFEVAGRKYPTFEKAVEAINRISGKNAEIIGEKRDLEGKVSSLEGKINSLSSNLEEALRINEEWRKYYAGEGDQPTRTEPLPDIESVVDEKLTARERKKAEDEKRAQFKTELDEIFEEPDFDDVKPFFEDLVNEYDGIPKVAPKKLYERARKEFKNSEAKDKLDDPDFKKLVDEGIKRELAKKEAAKESGASGGAAKPPEPLNASPEIEDYFKNR